MSPTTARLVRLSEDECATLGRLAGAGLTTAGELIEWAEHQDTWQASARQVRDGIARAETIAALLDAAASGRVDLAIGGLQAWLDGYARDVLTTLDDDRALLHRAPGTDERSSAYADIDEDLDALLLVRRLRTELDRCGGG
jgi:hypothetical protein